MGQTGPLEIMALPLAECLVLVGIHSYLGIHVLRRQVIFVDLALAQIAALGSTIAFLFAIEPLSKGAYVFSLLATVIGAALFSLTRFRKEKIPQEAIIGLAYALAAAVGILLVARAPHGAEHIQKILTGDLLWVKPREVLAAAVVYSGVGLFHYVFRDKFLAISTDPEKARADGINIRLWDFLFYISFGLVITHSVRTAGVLLVFIFLVIPAMIGVLLTKRLKFQLFIGWGVGVAVSVAGLAISYWTDSSTGPTVVSLYGGTLVAIALGAWVWRAKGHRGSILATVLLGIAVVAGVGVLFGTLGSWMGQRPYWAQEEQAPATHVNHGAHQHTPPHMRPAEVQECRGDCPIQRLLHELEPLDIMKKTERLSQTTDPILLEEVLGHVPLDDLEMRLVVARRLSQVAPKPGLLGLKPLLECAIPMIRSDATDAIVAITNNSYGFDPWVEPTAPVNKEPLEKLKASLSEPR